MSAFFSAQAQRKTVTEPKEIKHSSDVVLQLQRELTEGEIDAHIKSLGDLADRAYKAGDKDAARGWMTAMYAAIAGRTPAHKARIQAEIDRRIDELTFDGEWAHAERRRLA
jgi:hypothetical protein